MNEEKEKEVSTQVENNPTISWKKGGRIMLYVVSGALLLVVLFISFLQFSTFTVKPQASQGLNSFLADNDVLSQVTVQAGEFQLEIPLSDINQELIKQALEKESNIHNLEFDVLAGKAMVNYKVKGFYIPILYQLEPKADSQIHYHLKPVRIGKVGLPLPGWLFSRLQPILQTSLTEGLTVASETFARYGWESNGWNQTDTAVQLKMSLAGQALDEIVMELKGLPENEVKYIYEAGNQAQKEILRLVAGYPATKEELKTVLIDSYFVPEPMFQNFLLLMNAELMEKTFTAYPFMKGKYNLNMLLKKRSDLIAESISGYGKEILKVTKEWMETSGGEFYNNGYPFLKKDLRTVTIKEVIETWNLSISESLIKRIHFGLDMADHQLTVVYIVDAGNYAIIKENGYFVVDEQTYQARYHRPVPLSGQLTQDIEIWQAVSDKLKASFQTEQLFIRYMKDDGQDVFVLSSFLEKPQDVQAVSFSKIDGQWQPTASNFKDIHEFQAQDARFNLNLYTNMFEDPKLIYIDEDAYDNIVEELTYAHKLPAGEKPVYYSYKGKYIYVKLSGGDEYLLTTYHQYLDKIYTRENALALFGDVLPPIILLQPAPVALERAGNE